MELFVQTVIAFSQPAFICSKLATETLEQGVEYFTLRFIVNFEHLIAGWVAVNLDI